MVFYKRKGTQSACGCRSFYLTFKRFCTTQLCVANLEKTYGQPIAELWFWSGEINRVKLPEQSYFLINLSLISFRTTPFSLIKYLAKFWVYQKK